MSLQQTARTRENTSTASEAQRGAESRAPAEGAVPHDGPNWLAVAAGTALLGPLGGLAAYAATRGSATTGAAATGATATRTAPPPATAATGTVALTAPAVVTLGENLALTAAAGGGTASSFTFEIKRAAEAAWVQLSAGAAAAYRAPARVPGNFQVRVRAQVDGREVSSATSVVAVQFMDLAAVKASGTCSAWFTTAWTETKAAVSDGSRREQGFWIRYNTTNLQYEKYGDCIGTAVANNVGAVLDTIANPVADSAVAPNSNGNFTVAWYHTHTPTVYRVGGRGTGPSDGDLAYAAAKRTPGLAHDYTINPAPQGHPIDSPVQVYDCGAFVRKVTPA